MVATVSTVSSASGATRYYEKDGYYAKHDPEHKRGSFWHGKAAEELGLSNQVDPDTFHHILEGYVPDHDIRLGRVRDGEHQHRPGYDLTLSAPKSVSLAGLVMGDKRILEAHDAAVRNTLDFVEDRLLETRIFVPETQRRPRIATPHMIAATFRHEASRNLDPQIHTHCIIANMTHDESGQWRSVEPTMLRRGQWLIGAYYRNELAQQVMKLGYEINPTLSNKTQSFEIAGYDREVIDVFSTRRQDILKCLEEQGWENNREMKQRAALMTRGRKNEPDRAELYENWKEQFNSLELERDLGEINRSRMTANKETELDQIAADREHIATKTTSQALANLEERNVTFSRNRLIEKTLVAVPGRLGIAEIETAIDNLHAQNRLVDGKSPSGEHIFTTDHAIRAEKDIMARLSKGAGQAEPIANRDEITATLHGTKINDGQRQAVGLILQSDDRIVGIQGTAGSGKTYMLGQMREIAEAKETEVLGLAPTASAARTLEVESGIPSSTLQSFLLRHQDIADGTANQNRVAELKDNFRDKILAVDESSLIGLVQMRDLVRVADILEIPRLALIGDYRQLEGVEAGSPFRLMPQMGMEVERMKTILRQRDPILREAVEYASIGQPVAALDMLKESVIEAGQDNQEHLAAATWLELNEADRANTMILAPMRWQRDEINELVRETLVDEGRLTDDGIEITKLDSHRLTRTQKQQVEYYTPGDAVVFAIDSPQLGLKASEVYMITGRGDDFVHLTNRDEEVFQFDPRGNSKIRHDIAARLDIYEIVNFEIKQGDKIRWTRNDHDRDLLNASTAEIIEAKQDSITIKTDDGRMLEMAANDRQLSHCDYAYASTVHAAQGRTVDRVIALLDSESPGLTDQKTFYVEISRARDEVIIITDDRLDLSDALAATSGEMQSALEAINEAPMLENEIIEPEAEMTMELTEEPPPLDLEEDLDHEHNPSDLGNEHELEHENERENEYELEL
jgi:conjugative relaxase-like TrwC/TraI family protein